MADHGGVLPGAGRVDGVRIARPSLRRPRRREMNQLARRAVPAFVVVALAINLVACGSPPGGPSAEPSRSAAAPSPSTGTAEPSTSSTVFPPAGVLKMGERQAITLEGVRSTFTVPTATGSTTARSVSTNPPVPCLRVRVSSSGRIPRSVSSPIHAPRRRARRSARRSARCRTRSRRCPLSNVVESPVDVRVGGRPREEGRGEDPRGHRL